MTSELAALRLSAESDWLPPLESRDVGWVENERVQAQPGEYHGGWVTSEIVGPFKGEFGTGG